MIYIFDVIILIFQKIETMSYLIPELCNAAGLTDAIRKDFKIMKDIAQVTQVSPDNRRNTIRKFIKEVNSNTAASQILSGWGITLDDDIMSFPGRKVDDEDIFFGDQVVCKGSIKANWSNDAVRNPVLQTVIKVTRRIRAEEKREFVHFNVFYFVLAEPKLLGHFVHRTKQADRQWFYQNAPKSHWGNENQSGAAKNLRFAKRPSWYHSESTSKGYKWGFGTGHGYFTDQQNWSLQCG